MQPRDAERPSGKYKAMRVVHEAERETLTNTSKDSVDKLLRRVNRRGLLGKKKQANIDPESEPKRSGKQVVDTRVTWNDLDSRGCTNNPVANDPMEVGGASSQKILPNSDEDMDDVDREDVSTPAMDLKNNHPDGLFRMMNTESLEPPDSAKRKPIRRTIACDQHKRELKINGKQVVDARVACIDLGDRGCTTNPVENDPRKVDRASLQNTLDVERESTLQDNIEEMDEIDWEDGLAFVSDSANNHTDDGVRTMTIEFTESPDSAKRKPVRRATAEDKELAELVHKVHLLCLLARGRIIDSACDDPLIQASLLSLLPVHLMKILEVSKLTADALSALVHWFHNNFHVRSSITEKRAFNLGLAFALEAHEGTPEEIAALSVALFRALKLNTRFVSILNVAPLKPDADRCESSSQDASGLHLSVFNTSTLMVDRPKEVVGSPVKSFLSNEKGNANETMLEGSCKSKDGCRRSKRNKSKDTAIAVQLKDQTVDPLACEAQDNISEACISKNSQVSKRKGDLEFEKQLQMALSATAIESSQISMGSDVKNLNSNSPNVSYALTKKRRVTNEESPSQGISTAVGSRKVGSPLYWAEVYCCGENMAGRWVHVDTVNAIIDGEQKVEAAAAACKTCLRYVVAFSGRGAKDVTRRYCVKWYKIASQRINSVWWDAVLAPLRELESGATGGNSGSLDMPTESGMEIDVESSWRSSCAATRNCLEDMELETRALTEPLPTNQQAYKNHPLYAIERWLTKCQILHPKGPILGFCSGHPVYPRTCVKTLKTKEKWLREGLQVKVNELPTKVLKQPGKLTKVQFSEDDYGAADSEGIIELYGNWQLEPLQLPHAVNGIVPKNERGQVEVWSEKCLPPGTVHIRLPRVFYVAKRLEIDYAPAMVGFEFKNGRSIPVFDGIVVCSEFKDAILEAYAEEEERREANERKKNEAQAASRWYQLLSSIIIRQRLNNSYGNTSVSSQIPSKIPNEHVDNLYVGCLDDGIRDPKFAASSMSLTEDHQHVFLVEDQSFDEESSTRTKRCRCGFSVEVEEL